MATSPTLTAAKKLIERRFAPVPVPFKKKKPVLEGWQNLRLTEETVGEHFNGVPQNVGLLLGAPSDNLADADLDSEQARLAGPFYFPETAWMTGRASAPRSHYWYRMPTGLPAKTHMEFRDPVDQTGEHKGLLLELRAGDGLQSLMVPSVHPSGESIESYGDLKLDPANVEAAELVKAASRVAAAALLGKHWPGGSFHTASLALAGALKKAGWPRDDAATFVEAVAAASHSQDVKDRLAGVESTYDKDTPTTGAKKLGELIDQRVVSKALEWLGIRPAKKRKIRELPPYQPFPVEALPIPLATYVEQASRSLGCDPAFVALPMLAAIASAIGNTRVIYLGREWKECSVVWSGIVADSGTLKTPAISKAVGHFYRIQKRLLDEHRIAMDQYEIEIELWKEAKAAAKKKGGVDPGNPPEQPVLPRVIIGDVTIEKLAEVHEDNPRGAFVVRDELAGWFGSFTRYKGKAGGTDLPNWMQMFNSGALIVDRKTGERRTLFIPSAATSVTGGIQPGVLAHVLTQDFLDAGLAARLLMAMPPKRAKVWTDAEIDPTVSQMYHDVIDRLLQLTFRVEDNEQQPHSVRLSAPAKTRWVSFYNEWAIEQANAEGEIAAALSKLEAYAARFALIHHVVSHVSVDADDLRPVGVKSIEAGITLCLWFAAEARRIYGTLNETNDDRDARRLIEFIRGRGGRITARDLQKSNSRKYADSDQARHALDLLVQADLGYWTQPPTGPRGGQPAVSFVLNPDGTTDTTDSTPESGDDGDGQGARQNPPEPDKTPDNSQEKPGTVGSVGSAKRGVFKVKAVGAAVEVDGVLSEGGPVMSDTPHVLIDRQDDLSMVVGAVEDTGLVGLDIETTGLKPRTDTARLLSLCCDTTDGTTMVYVVDLAAVDPTPLWELLKGRPIVGHNLAFDLAFLAKFGFEPADVRDTIIESRVLYTGDNTARKHSLADCCKRELNFDLDKTIQASDWSGPLTPQQIAYAALDADLARRLHIALDPKIEAAKLREVVDLENRDLPAMIWLAQSGIGFDRDAWSAVATESETEREQVRSDLDAAAPPKPQGEMFGPSWNWDSPADVKAALKAVGHEITTTSDDALAEIEHPLGGLIRQYRSAAKRVGTYGREWLKHVSADGRVYASWQQIGADSGRMACSKPNLQNLPRDVRYRRCFAASPGRALVKADYSQIELRLAAKIANEPTMIEAYRRGDDLHTLTASKILGKVDVTKDDRQLAKSLNFGLLYGMGAANLRVYCRSNYGVELTEQQAKEYRAAFFETYPGLARWQRTAGGSRDKAITTYTISGRHRLNVTRFSEKLNTPVQGSGADGLKAALALLWDRRGEHPTAFPVLVVHDEIVVECDHGEADSVSHWLKQAMIDGMDNFANPVPVEVEVSVASTWGGDRA